jgi:hypothetical protein
MASKRGGAPLAFWATGSNHARAASSGAIRSESNPTGDLAEALVAEFYGVEPKANLARRDLRH